MLLYHTSAHPSNPPTVVLRLLPHRQSLAQRPALLTAPTNEVISLLLQRCHPFAGYISPATKSLPGAGHKQEVYHPSQSLSNPQITFRQFVTTRLVSRFAAAFTASYQPNPQKHFSEALPGVRHKREFYHPSQPLSNPARIVLHSLPLPLR